MYKIAKGILDKIEPKKTQKGKLYLKVNINEQGQNTELFDWNNQAQKFPIGTKVLCEFEDGEYPKLKRIDIDDGVTTTQQTIGNKTVVTEDKPHVQGLKHYAVAKLAVDLVKYEQIQVDEKIKRFKEAFNAILSTLTTAGVEKT